MRAVRLPYGEKFDHLICSIISNHVNGNIVNPHCYTEKVVIFVPYCYTEKVVIFLCFMDVQSK
jgi:hypothetical protein